MTVSHVLHVVLLIAISNATSVVGQAPIQHGPSDDDGGYLTGKEPDFLNVLPPYPELNSIEDREDIATFKAWQQPGNSARWHLANADVKMHYDRFVPAFGMEINPKSTPLLVHLLDRVEQDVQSVAFSAKSFYNRARPYQRFQMEHVCGAERAPAPEVPLNGGSSYPSGHTSFGWAAVLILADVAPERGQSLLARGREYGESRIVCSVHYPSDVVGGELVAATVVERLHSESAFRKDLDCAKQEHAAARKELDHVGAECRVSEPEHSRE